MLKRMSVVFCGAAVVLMTAGYATAQSATQEAKDKTKAAAKKTVVVVSDAEITAAVKTKLLADTTVGGLKIDVDTTNGVVTLTGPVHSGVERAQALKLARKTSGVKRVVNKLKMEPIKKEVGTSGSKDTTVVIKDDATPKLKKGAEKTEDAAKKAGQATKDAAKKTGEKIKDTSVEVKDDTKPALGKAGTVVADAAITSAVKTKLLGDTKVAGMKIDVDTSYGVVTLTGTVNSATEKAEAIRLATNTTGVKSVVDKLTVVVK